MGLWINGQMVWQVGDVAYYYAVDGLIQGLFQIEMVLTNNTYRGRLLSAQPGDFAYRFMATGEQLTDAAKITTT
jgi:hypothetical protein